MDFYLRDVVDQDISPLAKVYAEAFKPEKTGEAWTEESARQLIEYCYNKSSSDLRLLVLNNEEEMIGAFFADVKPWWDGPRIVNAEFFVHPDYQANGAGRMLFTTVLTRAKKNHNVVNFETITFMPEKQHPLKWYLKLGFQKEENWVIINGDIDLILSNLNV